MSLVGGGTRRVAKRDGASYVQKPTEQEEIRLLCRGLTSLNQITDLSVRGGTLRGLHLHGNAIASVVGLSSACPFLEVLVLSSNELTNLDGVLGLRHLRVLDVACNRLDRLPPLGSLASLNTLLAAYNRVNALDCLVTLWGPSSALTQIDLRDNLVGDIAELAFLCGLHRLRDLRLQGPIGMRECPVCRLSGYSTAVLRASPALLELDEKQISDELRKSELASASDDMRVPSLWPLPASDISFQGVKEAESTCESGISEGSKLKVLEKLLARCQQLLDHRAEAPATSAHIVIDVSERAMLDVFEELRVVHSKQRALLANTSRVKETATGLSAQILAELQVVSSEVRRRDTAYSVARRRLEEVRREVQDAGLKRCSLSAEVAAQRISLASELAAARAAIRSASDTHTTLDEVNSELEAAEVRSAAENTEISVVMAEAQARMAAVAEARAEFETESSLARSLALARERWLSVLQGARAGRLRAELRHEAEAMECARWTTELACAVSRLESVVEAATQASESGSQIQERWKARTFEAAQQLDEVRASADSSLRAARARLENCRAEEAALLAERSCLCERYRVAEEVQTAEERALAEDFRWRLAALSERARAVEAQDLEAQVALSVQEQSNRLRALAAEELRDNVELVELELQRSRLRASAEAQALERAEGAAQRQATEAEEGHMALVSAEAKLQAVAQERDAEYVAIAVLNAARQDLEALEMRQATLTRQFEVQGEEIDSHEEAVAEGVGHNAVAVGALRISEARSEELVQEFQTQFGVMDALQCEYNALEKQQQAQRTALAEHMSQGRAAEAAAEGLAEAERDAAEDAELQELRFRDEILALSEDIEAQRQASALMQEEVDDLRAAWSAQSALCADEVQLARVESLQVSEEADRRLAAQSAELAGRLRRQRQVSERLRGELRVVRGEYEAYEAEGAALAAAWRSDRAQLASEVAAVADELRAQCM